jgi:hypothetical protein
MNAPCPPNPNFPPFPLNPVVGQRWLGWVWNGAQWVQTPASGMQVLCTVFNASGPYMPSPGLVSVMVECIGGGGGGGGALSSVDQVGLSGGGGGSGGYSRKTLPASLVAGGVVITIGAGGAEGGVTNPGYIGGNGGVTSFGALCVANGGIGGGTGTAAGAGGPGAPPGVGDVASPGAAGISGLQGALDAVIWIHAGAGGTMWGGNQPPEEVANATAYPPLAIAGGAGAPNTGAGGTGGAGSRTTSGAPGGLGGSGQCIVTEYCWADVAPGEDCGCAPGGARIAGGFDDC